MKTLFKAVYIPCLAALLGACSTMATVSSTTPGTELHLKERVVELPSDMKINGTSFGNYEFKAVEPGHDPFYGILPLAFRGDLLTADLLFFTPGTFFNLRSAFPFYEIDVDQGLIRYKDLHEDAWHEYRPKTTERDRARDYFENYDNSANASGEK